MTRRCVVLGFLGVAACQPLPEGARQYIAERYTCPLPRVTARELTKKPSELRAETYSPKEPSKEVAADPARLAMWKQQQLKEREQLSSYDYNQLIEVTGCGMVYVLECHRRSKISNGQSSVSCSQMTKTPLAAAH